MLGRLDQHLKDGHPYGTAPKAYGMDILKWTMVIVEKKDIRIRNLEDTLREIARHADSI